MRTRPLARYATPHPRRAQAGIGLVQAALLVTLVGAAVATGLVMLKASAPSAQAERQEEALRWADQALVAYAAQNARLPCAVATPTSAPTDCVAPGQKGWLPTRALEAVHPGGPGPSQPLRYMVYRGDTATDLAVASNAFDPHDWERTPITFNAVNGLDLCAKLAQAARETAAGTRTDRARTTEIGGTAINVAYGLGAPGPSSGDAGGRFDGVNQAADAVLESPARASDSRYDDRVRVRDFNALAQTLGCGFESSTDPDGLVLASIDMLALSAGVSQEVLDQHAANKESTELAVAMAAVSEVFAILNVALSAASIANSASTLATATAQLSAAIASCVVLVGCGLIPPYTAAVTAAGIAIGLASTATGLAAAALAATSAALALTVQARDMADAGPTAPAANIAAAAEKTCLAAEGGFLRQVVGADGSLVTVDPPQWRNGLRQDVETVEAELLTLEADAEANRLRLIDLEKIPSTTLIDYPPAPTRGATEPDAVWNARYQAWLDTRRQHETLLQAKLQLIRTAEQAHVDWDTAVQEVTNSQKELDQMRTAVTTLTGRVQQCDATPPPRTDLVGIRRCTNDRLALQGMTTCDLDILTSTQVQQRQCLPWKIADHDTAVAARTTARNAYEAAENAAVAAPEPPIKDYITNSGWFSGVWSCQVLSWCDPLIVRNQSDSDKRETYAKSVYKSHGLQAALREKRSELDEKRVAYDAAQGQCNVLRSLQLGGSTPGTEAPPVWSGATAILQAANCKGATGAVTPNDCRPTP